MTEALLTTPAPIFKVEAREVSELSRDIVRLKVEETVSGLKTFSARFLAFGPYRKAAESLIYLNGTVFDFGKEISVSIGSAQAAREIFKGKISAQEAEFAEEMEPEVVVFAEDDLMNLRMIRRMRTYENMSDADIARDIASQHSLAADVDIPGPTYDVVQQWNMSDLAFLRERARLVQAEVWVGDGTLYFKGREQRDVKETTLVQGNELIYVRLRADLAHQRTEVHVTGYNADDRSAIDESADASAIQAEVSGGRTGPDILGRSFGPRVSYRVREVALTESEAGDWANAEMLRRSRSFVRVSGTTRGTPELAVGSRLNLERVGAPFKGSGYYVTQVCHTYDNAQGYRTRFEAERGKIEASS